MPRLIDADRLKEEIVEAGQESTRYRIGEFWELNRNEIWKVIDEQPTVEERKRGEWESTGWWSRIHKCSQCGNALDFDGVNAGRGDANFCPNCGADMRKERNG